MGEHMKIYYLYNENVRDSLNEKGYDYTPAYIEALLLYMGISAEKISSDKLSLLEKDDILMKHSKNTNYMKEILFIGILYYE